MTKPERFDGKVNLTVDDSEPWWPPLPEHAHGPRPNVLLILFDDTGFAHFGCYGSTIDTPNIDALAARGLCYSNFHVTPLCSPSRAAILTGRNHHAVGMRTIANYHDGGFPNMRAAITPRAATLAEILQGQGYATCALGKWHLCPAEENSAAGPYDDWPLQRGFDHYYGFLSGATDQFYPELTCDNHHIDPPRTPEEGYHVTEDLVDHAIGDLRDIQSNRPQQPFFMYLSLGAMHEPHQAPREYVEKYHGRFDAGWDEVRRQWYERQLASGIIPPDTELAPRNPGVDAWNDVPDNQQKFANRLQEAFAGFLDHSDAQIGRLLDYLETSDQLDNTIVILTSDNGASGMGGPSDRPGGPHDGLRYHYTPPVSHLHSGPAPVMALGNWEISADIERTADDVEGVLFAAGNMSGGISFYVQNNRLKLDYNARIIIFKGATDTALPVGRVTVSVIFSAAADGSGRVVLMINGQAQGEVRIPSIGGAAGRGGADVGADRLSPVTDSYSAPFPFAGTIHSLDVVITPKARREPTPEEQSEAG